eukprot:1708931-Karenia_brevis.AAC.1
MYWSWNLHLAEFMNLADVKPPSKGGLNVVTLFQDSWCRQFAHQLVQLHKGGWLLLQPLSQSAFT